MKSNKDLYAEYRKYWMTIDAMANHYKLSYEDMANRIMKGELEAYKEAMDIHYPVRKKTFVVDFILFEDDIPQRLFIDAVNAEKAVNEFFAMHPSCTMLSCVEAWEKGMQQPVLVDE